MGVAYLVSKFFDGMEAFHQMSGPGYGDKERKGNWNTVLKNGHGGGQSYLRFRMLACSLLEEGFIPGFWARIWCKELGLNWEDTRRVGKSYQVFRVLAWTL